MALTPAEKQRAYRERQKSKQVTEQEAEQVTNVTEEVTDVTEQDPEPVTEERPRTLRGLISAARMGWLTLTEREEQAIRDHWGYADSEKRTLLQRDAAHAKIAAQAIGPADWRPSCLAEIPAEWYDPGYVEEHFDQIDFSGIPITEHVYLPDLEGQQLARLAVRGRLQPLTLSAFPNQREGDLTPTPEQRAKLG